MAQAIQIYFSQSFQTYRWAYILMILWVLSMIGLPIMLWNLGEGVIPVGVHLAAILQAGAVFVMVQTTWGWKNSLKAFLIVAMLTWFAEWLGHTTDFPFGAYNYTDRLQPQIAGVPLLIPVAWFMLLPACWALAQAITTQSSAWKRRISIAIISACALTAWDLFLDPQMVGWNFWVWDHPSGYFGIPFVNYLGWLLVSGIVTFVINPAPLPLMPLALVYTTVWILQSIGQTFFWGQPGPAFFGFIGMGTILLLAVMQTRKRTS